MINPMIEIFLIAAAVSFATNLLRRKLMGPEDMAKMMESQKFKKELLEAQKKGDKKALQRLMKKQEYYSRIDAEIGKKNMIMLFASLGIFYFVFMVILTPLYGSLNVVGTLPGGLVIPLISTGDKLTYIGWYILSLLATGLPLGKIFQAQPKLEQSPKEMERVGQKGRAKSHDR